MLVGTCTIYSSNNLIKEFEMNGVLFVGIPEDAKVRYVEGCGNK